MYEIYFFCGKQKRVSGARGSSLVVSADGHARDRPLHQGASVGPSRAPWRVPWAFKVAKSSKQPRDCFPTS